MKKLLGLCVLFLIFSAFAEKATYSRGIVEGKIPTESIRKDFMSGMPQFRSCHQTNIESGGKHYDKVLVNFFIGKNGKAHSPQVLGDIPKTMKDCLIASLVGLQFQPFTDDGEVEVNQPIQFKAYELTGTKEKE